LNHENLFYHSDHDCEALRLQSKNGGKEHTKAIFSTEPRASLLELSFGQCRKIGIREYSKTKNNQRGMFGK